MREDEIAELFSEKCRSLGGTPYLNEEAFGLVMRCKIGSYEKAKEMIWFVRGLEAPDEREIYFSVDGGDKLRSFWYSLKKDPKNSYIIRGHEGINIKLMIKGKPLGLIQKKFEEYLDSITEELSNGLRSLFQGKPGLGGTWRFKRGGGYSLDIALYGTEFKDEELEAIFQNAENTQKEAQEILDNLKKNAVQVSDRTTILF
jgi:hypothetical protein